VAVFLDVVAVFVLSCLGLAVTGYLLVRGAELLSEKRGISRFLVGFILLSVITSLPELSVATFSSLAGVVYLSVGDILGSNVVNVALVAALSTFFVTGVVYVGLDVLRDLAGILYFSSIIPILMIFIPEVAVELGVLLLAFFMVYIYLSFRSAPANARVAEKVGVGYNVIVSMVVVGGVGVVVSAYFLVESVEGLVLLTGLSELEVGAKIVSISTSAPEIATTLLLSKRGVYDMALGNAVGSNLTNVTLILGALLIISGQSLVFSQHVSVVLFVLLASSTFWFFISRGALNRMSGVLLLLIYLFFLTVAK